MQLVHARRLAAVALLGIAVLAGCDPAPPPAHPTGTPPPGVAAQILDLTNRARAAGGLGALAWNFQLADLATAHSQWMAGSGQFVHTDLAATLRGPGYEAYRCLGENILQGPSGLTAQQLFDYWMNSPAHRENILNPNFDSIGFGTATSPDGRLWATQEFGCWR